MPGQVLDQEARDRHLAALVRLGGSPHHPKPLDGSDRLGDDCPSLGEVDPADTQRGHLAEPHASVCKEEDNQPVHLVGVFVVGPVLADLSRIAACGGQGIDLRVGQVAALVLDRPRQVDLRGDVAGQPAVPDKVTPGRDADPLLVVEPCRRRALAHHARGRPSSCPGAR